MDPLGNFPDEDIWRALANSHLKTFVSSLSEGKLLLSGGGCHLWGQGDKYYIKVGATEGTLPLVITFTTPNRQNEDGDGDGDVLLRHVVVQVGGVTLFWWTT